MDENDPRLFKALLENLFDGVYVVDTERRITFFNSGAERLTGFSAKEVVGRQCADNVLMHTDAQGTCLCPSDLCPAAAVMREGVAAEHEVFLHHKDGHRVAVVTRIAPLRAADGTVIGALEVFSDNTAQLAAEQEIQRLEKLSMLDPLTGLGNRRFAEMVLAGRLEELRRYGWPLAVGFADIDRFKQINDSRGHPVGDLALRMVARTLTNGVRASDTVTRWGGEEFLLVLPGVEAAHLGPLLEKLRRLVESSALDLSGGLVKVEVSLGGTLARHDDTPESLVERVDALMYASKGKGRNRVTVDEASET